MTSKLMPVVRTPPQRTDMDCAVVALAMLTGVSYEDVLVLAGAAELQAHRKGMWDTHIVAIAHALGFELKHKKAKTIDWEHDAGILTVRTKSKAKKRKYDAHAAVLRWGLVFDDAEVWEPDAYLYSTRAEVTGLLTVKED